MSEEKCTLNNWGICNAQRNCLSSNKCKDYPNCYYKKLQQLEYENKRLREVIKDIKFEAEFNGNDESVQKMFMIAEQALGE